MFRWSTVVLLIATLVACPFRCGGAFGVVCSAESKAEAASKPTRCGCECCRHERPASSEDRDSDQPLPAPCDCGSCVCEGAVLPEKVLLVVDDAPAVPLAAVCAWTVPLEAADLPRSGIPSPDAEPSRSGRSVRLLHRSLQI